MSWPETLSRNTRRRFLRLAGVIALGGLTAGCFQPLYGDASLGGKSDIRGKLASVDVLRVDVPNGTPLARIGVHLRNQLIYTMTGGGAGTNPEYRLSIRIGASQRQVIVDIDSGRPEVVSYGLSANYYLTEIATGKQVIGSVATAQVSYNIPGQEQRFAGARGLRDAEDRAADVLARSINARVASYFVAGT
jgi:LPS-assembly lipoprotein